MKVLIDFNGWKKVEDVPESAVFSGRLQLLIMPPLDFFCHPGKVVKGKTVTNLIVYNTGLITLSGLPIFSNKLP